MGKRAARALGGLLGDLRRARGMTLRELSELLAEHDLEVSEATLKRCSTTRPWPHWRGSSILPTNSLAKSNLWRLEESCGSLRRSARYQTALHRLLRHVDRTLPEVREFKARLSIPEELGAE